MLVYLGRLIRHYEADDGIRLNRSNPFAIV